MKLVANVQQPASSANIIQQLKNQLALLVLMDKYLKMEHASSTMHAQIQANILILKIKNVVSASNPLLVVFRVLMMRL